MGSKDYIGFIKEKYIYGKNEDKDLPTLKSLKKGITIADIENQVDEVITDKISRNIKIYLSRRHTGENLDNIGWHFGIGGSAVCQAGRRIAEKIEQDHKSRKAIKKIESNLSRMKI